MKTPRTANVVGHIDDDLITAAAECKKKTKHSPWLKWGSIAACFCLIITASIIMIPYLNRDDSGTQSPDISYAALPLFLARTAFCLYLFKNYGV